MLRLGRSVLTQHISSSSTSPVYQLHRLLSASAPRISPNPSFAVEDYLVGTCGLTRAQALKASTKLSHLKSPTNPDAVLAFLAGIGLSSADVAAVVAKDPQFLCARVEKTLASNVSGLTGLGLSSSEVARLVLAAPERFRRPAIVSKLQYYLPLFGSCENVLRALKYGYFLSSDLENIVKPNIAILRECGLDACSIAKLSITMPRLLNCRPESLQAMVASAEGLGVPRGSLMFMYALRAVAFLSKEKIAAQVDYLKNTFNWSDAEVSIAVLKAPSVLKRSKETLQRMSEFLINEVGLEPGYIAYQPIMLSLSLEGRLRPRYYVVKFLRENGLVDHDWRYDTIAKVTEKVFMEKFISPHKEAAPHLSEDFAAACRVTERRCVHAITVEELSFETDIGRASVFGS